MPAPGMMLGIDFVFRGAAAIDWLLFVTRCLRRWIESAKSNLQRMRDAH